MKLSSSLQQQENFVVDKLKVEISSFILRFLHCKFMKHLTHSDNHLRNDVICWIRFLFQTSLFFCIQDELSRLVGEEGVSAAAPETTRPPVPPKPVSSPKISNPSLIVDTSMLQRLNDLKNEYAEAVAKANREASVSKERRYHRSFIHGCGDVCAEIECHVCCWGNVSSWKHRVSTRKMSPQQWGTAFAWMPSHQNSDEKTFEA